jgi:predicted RNA-binding Zn ribbon-like protein
MSITIARVHKGERVCLDFVNSRSTDHRGSGTIYDLLPSADWWHQFGQRWSLQIESDASPPLGRLEKARACVRRVLEAWAVGANIADSDLDHLDDLLSAAPIERRLRRGADQLQISLEPVHRNWAWVMAEIADSTVSLMASGQRERLKVCANPDCTWMFWDASRNVSGRWCDPPICGNLVKVRNFRHRHRRPS